MRKFILAAALAATVVPSVAMADPPSWAPANGYRHQDRDNHRDWRDHDRGDWHSWNHYDWYRHDPRDGHYDPARYYRDGRYYRERRLTRYDRIYRGDDGRYYCRRSDGTTGLIIGAAAGGLLGNAIADGHSATLATLIGAGAGAAIGHSIDRGNIRCR